LLSRQTGLTVDRREVDLAASAKINRYAHQVTAGNGLAARWLTVEVTAVARRDSIDAEAINTEAVLLGRQADVIDDAERRRSAIRALLDSRSEAVWIKDIEALMSLYSPDLDIDRALIPGRTRN
jgi:hypothetical protein